jgi:F420-non-reducing hydrogenase iron-sulfur subunit
MNSQNVKITVFYCTNSIEPEDIAGRQLLLDGVTLQPIGLPCSGKVDVPYLIKAFETGADGAVIVTCKQNECRHLEGNLRANKRSQAVEALLEEIGVGKGRMAVVMLKDGGVPQALEEIKGFADRIKKLPHLQLSATLA